MGLEGRVVGGKAEVRGKRKIYGITAFSIGASHQRLLHRVKKVIFEDCCFELPLPYLFLPPELSIEGMTYYNRLLST